MPKMTVYEYPDGTKVTVHSDGSVTIDRPNQSAVRIDPNGNLHRNGRTEAGTPNAKNPRKFRYGDPNRGDADDPVTGAEFFPGPPPRVRIERRTANGKVEELINLTNGNRTDKPAPAAGNPVRPKVPAPAPVDEVYPASTWPNGPPAAGGTAPPTTPPTPPPPPPPPVTPPPPAEPKPGGGSKAPKPGGKPKKVPPKKKAAPTRSAPRK